MTQKCGHMCHMIQIGMIKFLVKTCFEITFLNQKLDHTMSYSYIIYSNITGARNVWLYCTEAWA